MYVMLLIFNLIRLYRVLILTINMLLTPPTSTIGFGKMVSFGPGCPAFGAANKTKNKFKREPRFNL